MDVKLGLQLNDQAYDAIGMFYNVTTCLKYKTNLTLLKDEINGLTGLKHIEPRNGLSSGRPHRFPFFATCKVMD